MAAAKNPKDYSVDEVCVWMNAIGFGDKSDAIRENSVDGGFLITLGAEDFKELGFTSLQSKKVLHNLQLSKDFAESGGIERINELEAENAKLRAEIHRLKESHGTAPTPAPAPAPEQPRHNTPPRTNSPPPPSHHHQQRQEPGVVGGAAKGAVRGAVVGAVGGAILGDAGKGAKLGAAMGGTRGAMDGLGRRRFK